MTEVFIPIKSRELMLRALLTGSSGPANLYAGLSWTLAEGDVSIEDMEAGEPNGSGYGRKNVDPNDWLITSFPDGVEVINDKMSFANLSGFQWPTVRSCFIVTSFGKGGDMLIAWPLQTPVALPPDGRLRTQVSVRY